MHKFDEKKLNYWYRLGCPGHIFCTGPWLATGLVVAGGSTQKPFSLGSTRTEERRASYTLFEHAVVTLHTLKADIFLVIKHEGHICDFDRYGFFFRFCESRTMGSSNLKRHFTGKVRIHR